MSQLFSSIIKKLAKKSDDPELPQKTRKEKHVNFCRKESVIINENGDLVIDEADVASILRDDSFDNGYDTETETDDGDGVSIVPMSHCNLLDLGGHCLQNILSAIASKVLKS